MKKLLQEIGQWIEKIFSKWPADIKLAVETGITITSAIEKFDANNPEVADIITSLIPGNLDDTIKAAIRAELPKIVVELKLVDATLGLTDPNQIVAAAAKVIQQLDGDYSSAFLHSLSILITQVAANGKLNWSDAVIVVEWYYDNYVKKAA